MKPEFHVVSNGKLMFAEAGEMLKKIEPYIDYFHIREKEKSAKELFDGLEFLLEQGFPAEKLVINDRCDAALAAGIQRVQLGGGSLPISRVKQVMPSLHAGCSVHSPEEAAAAINDGADSLLYGHIFQSNSKKGLEPRGVLGLAEIVLHSAVPVIAIGGITPLHVKEVIKAGASGIAVISGIWNSETPVKAATEYRKMLGGMR
ncbi:thiamine phosphate synthase [Metabacillus sp. GX 13764]|uniref:thiamine phosphate synthase n=1 Tax=Metabacillus kandeliae TaxID=2900151 RepID=UPI001E4E1AF9|nr:thiamine phosphate synthase [Metabacillus kandeliae]MCD7035215.1 thiamine phosphate synthase [Metabacillus kandeliae]